MRNSTYRNSNSYNGRDNYDEHRQQQRMSDLEWNIERAIQNFDDFTARVAGNFGERAPVVHSEVFNLAAAEARAYNETSWFVSGSYYSERNQNTKLCQLEYKAGELAKREFLPRNLVDRHLPGYRVPPNDYNTEANRNGKAWGDWINGGFGSQRTQNDRMTMMELTLNRVNAEFAIVQNHTAAKIYNSMIGGQQNQVENLLKCGASLTYIDFHDDKNALERAWDSNDPRLMELVIEYGNADVANARFSDGRRPLRRAVDEDNAQTINELCRLGADITAGRGMSNICAKPTLLHTTADSGDLEVARALLANGANPNVAIQDGSYIQNTTSWLYRTCCGGISGTTPLHIAAKKYIDMTRGVVGLAGDHREGNAVEMMRELTRNGANPEIKDVKGVTPVKMLQDAGFGDIARTITQDYSARHQQNAVDRYVNRGAGNNQHMDR